MHESSFLNPAKVIAAAKLHEGMKIADFGTGSGFFTRAAARAVGKSGTVWAVDANRELLSRVKNLSLAEGLDNVEVMHGDIEHVHGSHLPEESFDFVIMANIFFAAEHKEAILTEAYRILRRNGRALVVDWIDSFGGLGPHPDHVVSKEQMVRFCEAQHFAYVEDAAAGAYHWGLIVRKKAK